MLEFAVHGAIDFQIATDNPIVGTDLLCYILSYAMQGSASVSAPFGYRLVRLGTIFGPNQPAARIRDAVRGREGRA